MNIKKKIEIKKENNKTHEHKYIMFIQFPLKVTNNHSLQEDIFIGSES